MFNRYVFEVKNNDPEMIQKDLTSKLFIFYFQNDT